MDALQSLINQEAARRGLSVAAQPSVTKDLFSQVLDVPIGGGISAQKKPQPPMGYAVLEGITKMIPRVGMVKNILDAGPVADGTLEHARKMGWLGN